jgi:hypothetical protein
VNSIAIAKKLWSVDMFPNPTTQQVTIVSKMESELLYVTVKDLWGRIVLERDLKTKSFLTTLDFGLLNGIYFVTITNSNNEKVTKKLVIAK